MVRAQVVRLLEQFGQSLQGCSVSAGHKNNSLTYSVSQCWRHNNSLSQSVSVGDTITHSVSVGHNNNSLSQSVSVGDTTTHSVSQSVLETQQLTHSVSQC